MSLIQCKLKVIRPPNLITENIDYSIANFGIIPFGHRLMGAVDMAIPKNGCSDLQPTYGAQFILIERGDCTFVTKVRNAEKAGYSLAIIGNNNDDPFQSDFEMADDGYGYQVQIPSIFIKKKHFDQLQNKAWNYSIADTNDEKIMLLLKFDVVKSEIVSVIFGLNLQDRESFKIIDDFKPYYIKLQDQNINYTLVYSIMNFQSESYKNNETNPDCICQNRYCAFDPDGDAIGTGKDVVNEVLRETCIFQKYPQKWFEYMDQFNFKCTRVQSYSVCSQQVMDMVGIPKQEIKNCFDDSFVDQNTSLPTKNDTNVINILLENQLHIQQIAGMNGYPSVLVNAQTYKGQITGKGIFGEICNCFEKTPKLCSFEVDDYSSPNVDESFTLYMVIITVIVVILLVLGFYFLSKLIKKDSQEVTQPKVNEMVSQYIKFYEGKDKQKEGSI
ncbi:unnamed protein product [Paramecium sonneborni]|uniref:PA domain-containing protein n=1 Tax=Paramecium sonneborni TaxID=65129 RepID=A0A8S1R731_9CILI|nr:unnamed protein product [Paramecium sonneborni]